MAEHARRRAGVARVFVGQPERLAAAWRRTRFAEARKEGSPPRNQVPRRNACVSTRKRQLGYHGEHGDHKSTEGLILVLNLPAQSPPAIR